ncbi:MAG TPA: type 4a pilus biogenesis protein PilO [Blastocatellia bacterium]|nr:type 4a pilus biogenesis protein PilO [Blastocatellia bacterium]
MAASMTSVMKGAEESGSFFGRLPWYYQMGLLLVLVILLIFTADTLLYSDTRAETVKIQEQVENLKAKNAQASIIRQNLAATEETLRQKREEMDRLRDLLPDQIEISRVYENIKDFMRAQKLELRQFAQNKPDPSEFYTAQKILVQVSGSYDSLGQFFSQLGFYKRILSVAEVDIKQAEDGAQEHGRSINASFVVTAYYITPENLEKLTSKKPESPADDDKKAKKQK